MVGAPANPFTLKRGFSWSPKVFTIGLAAISVMVGAWSLTWNNLGVDSRTFYAVARVEAAGGNPDDPARVLQEERRIESEVGPGTGRPANFPEILYGYPPVLTRAWQLLIPLGDSGFFWANDLLLLAAGLAGLEMLMIALSWRDRWLARAFFVASAPQVLGLLAGNPSNLLLLAYGAAALLISRRRGFVGGLLLGAAWIKPPIGIPVAAVLVLLVPGERARTGAGALCGTVLFFTINVAMGGFDHTLHWIQKLTPFLDGLSAHPRLVPFHCCMAGAPALFLDDFATPVALVLGIGIAAALAGTAWILARQRDMSGADSLVPLAIGTAATLLAAPYLHMNDLVLLALPLLVLASLPLNPLSRLALTAWGLGLELPLLVAAIGRPLVPAAFYERVSFGLVLSLLVAGALCLRRHGAAPAIPGAPPRP